MALKDVNLIDPDWMARRLQQRHIVLWLTGLAALLVLMGTGYRLYAGLAAKGLPADSQSAAVKADLAATATRIGEVQAQLGQLGRRIEGLGILAHHRPVNGLMAALADTINPHTWLTQLTIEPLPPAAQRIAIKGMSLSSRDLGELLDRLVAQSLWQDVQLIHAKDHSGVQGPDQGRGPGAMIEFEIHCFVTQGRS